MARRKKVTKGKSIRSLRGLGCGPCAAASGMGGLPPLGKAGLIAGVLAAAGAAFYFLRGAPTAGSDGPPVLDYSGAMAEAKAMSGSAISALMGSASTIGAKIRFNGGTSALTASEWEEIAQRIRDNAAAKLHR